MGGGERADAGKKKARVDEGRSRGEKLPSAEAVSVSLAVAKVTCQMGKRQPGSGDPSNQIRALRRVHLAAIPKSAFFRQGTRLRGLL